MNKNEENIKIDKEIINVEEYKKDNNVIIFYSALWCNPCKNIKDNFYKYINENNYVLDKSYEIKKEDFKKLGPNYKFIPLFIKTKYIQTSDINKFLNDI